MNYTIAYYSESVKADIDALPITLKSRYIVLSRRMVEVGANLGQPHTEAFGSGLFELRLKGAEGIARVFTSNLSATVDSLLAEFVERERTARMSKQQLGDAVSEAWNGFRAANGSFADDHSTL